MSLGILATGSLVPRAGFARRRPSGVPRAGSLNHQNTGDRRDTWLVLSLFLLLSTLPLHAQRATERYDESFRKYSKRFFGVAFDWRLFKAQALAESNLDSSAQSWVGARGVMQLMPVTFREIQSKNPEFSSIDDPEWNIAAGIYYDRRLWRLWRDSVDAGDHRSFMLASYNAGRVPILRAQELARRRALDPRLWVSVEMVASGVRNWRHRETLNYVRRIQDNLGRVDSRGRVVRRAPIIPPGSTESPPSPASTAP